VDYQLYSMLDCNKDGVIDYDDFTYAKSFLTYGKIDESIYY
jgi:Ca2+-binding EF-hand superfamily protein